jgi:Glycosyltransferase family 9 (heptosyltransferase)
MKTFIIENSAAPNAIGDTIASFPALHAFAWGEDIKVYLSAAKCRELFLHPKVEMLNEKPENGILIDVQELFPRYAGSGLSLTRAYMMAMGLEALAKSHYIPEIILNVGPEEPERKYDFLLAPFSNSDNGTGTKIWNDYSWILVAQEIKRNNLSIGLLGTDADIKVASQDGFLRPLEGLCELVIDRPLPDVCRLLRAAKVVIGVDNGIGYLGQGMRANQIILHPLTQHINWSANPWPNGINLQLSAQPGHVFGAIQHLLKNGGR